MARRRDEVLSRGLPWLVAERAGVIGYAYATTSGPAWPIAIASRDSDLPGAGRARPGRWALVAGGVDGPFAKRPARQMLAVIGDSQNAGSVGVHRCLGFEPAGTLHNVGWKFDRWLDVVMMQRPLGLAATQAAFGVMAMRKSKTLTTWLALVAAPLGRTVLSPARPAGPAGLAAPAVGAAVGCMWACCMQQPPGKTTVFGRSFPCWASACIALLSGIVYGLTPDERWDARHNPGPHLPSPAAGRR